MMRGNKKFKILLILESIICLFIFFRFAYAWPIKAYPETMIDKIIIQSTKEKILSTVIPYECDANFMDSNKPSSINLDSLIWIVMPNRIYSKFFLPYNKEGAMLSWKNSPLIKNGTNSFNSLMFKDKVLKIAPMSLLSTSEVMVIIILEFLWILITLYFIIITIKTLKTGTITYKLLLLLLCINCYIFSFFYNVQSLASYYDIAFKRPFKYAELLVNKDFLTNDFPLYQKGKITINNESFNFFKLKTDNRAIKWIELSAFNYVYLVEKPQDILVADKPTSVHIEELPHKNSSDLFSWCEVTYFAEISLIKLLLLPVVLLVYGTFCVFCGYCIYLAILCKKKNFDI